MDSAVSMDRLAVRRISWKDTSGTSLSDESVDVDKKWAFLSAKFRLRVRRDTGTAERVVAGRVSGLGGSGFRET
jgi:hypothetical protein